MRFRKLQLLEDDGPVMVVNTAVIAIAPIAGHKGTLIWLSTGGKIGVQDDFDDVARWWAQDGIRS